MSLRAWLGVLEGKGRLVTDAEGITQEELWGARCGLQSKTLIKNYVTS